LGRLSCKTNCDDYLYRQLNQLPSQFGQTFVVGLGEAPFYGQVLAVAPAKLVQLVYKCVDEWPSEGAA
jgi:hypothetical protein